MKAMYRYALVASLAVMAGSAYAVTLTDLNSTLDLNLTTAIHNNWDVDGQGVSLFESRYFLRVGGGTNDPVAALGGNTNSVLAPNVARVGFAGAGVQFELTSILKGGAAGSFSSGHAEVVRISNLTGAPITVSLFQYNDFDLNSTAGGDRAMLTSPVGMMQWEGTAMVNQNVTARVAPRWMIGSWPTVGAFIAGTTNNLPNATSPLGPGDMTYAWQWEVTLAPARTPGSTFVMSSDKVFQTVPEPASMLALGAGLAAVAARRRRK